MRKHPKTQLRKPISFWAIALAILVVPQLTCWGAYRVYKLKVVSFNERNRPTTQSAILTTLDPNQYEHYHSGYGRMVVKLVDTWYCPGDTSHKKFCKKPKERTLQRGLAGELSPKRENLPMNMQPVIP
ncbi:hypothetical protein EBT16_06500 [bacterium]|nr:hypothetical protein [bacterium]